MALMAGIHQARVHGVGCDLDVSMFDTAASLLNYLAAWTLNRGYHPEKTRHSSHPSPLRKVVEVISCSGKPHLTK